ncbi:MAG TPA: branched-chain amino acid ABC transporter permease [Jiangellaceae bacterium]|nr:branched-chain amino acid ABC transporter permease [Jiangellaceae bacterium]
MDWGLITGDALRALVGSEAIVFALAAIGLNVHFGYAGLLNFGQAAFLAVAAYGLATVVTTFGLPFWLGILVGFAGVILLAILLGIPTLRLRADYLAIVTIAAAEIIRLIFRSVSLRDTFGGSSGISGFSNDFFALNPYSGDVGFGPFVFSDRNAWVLTVGWILVALACLIVWALMRSPWGRVIKAIREDEDAVRSLGKNVYSYKMQALIIGGLLGALGGFMFALAQAAVQPDLFSPNLTFFAYTILILGGAARVFGPVVGAMIFWCLLQLTAGILTGAVRTGVIPTWLMDSNDVGAVRFMLVGIALLLLLVYRPQGIFGDRKEIALDAR